MASRCLMHEWRCGSCRHRIDALERRMAAWPHVGLKSLPSTPVVAGIAFASTGIRPIMLPFLGSIVPVKPPVVSHRLVPPTRFNSAFSTKAIRLLGVHERVNLRVSKGIPLVNKAFLGSAVYLRFQIVLLAPCVLRPFGFKPCSFCTLFSSFPVLCSPCTYEVGSDLQTF